MSHRKKAKNTLEEEEEQLVKKEENLQTKAQNIKLAEEDHSWEQSGEKTKGVVRREQLEEEKKQLLEEQQSWARKFRELWDERRILSEKEEHLERMLKQEAREENLDKRLRQEVEKEEHQERRLNQEEVVKNGLQDLCLKPNEKKNFSHKQPNARQTKVVKEKKEEKERKEDKTENKGFISWMRRRVSWFRRNREVQTKLYDPL